MLIYAPVYAVEMVHSGVTVGHVPRKVSVACSLFLRNDEGNSLQCIITGNRCHLDDLPQGGIEILCKLIFTGKMIHVGLRNCLGIKRTLAALNLVQFAKKFCTNFSSHPCL